MCGDCKDAKGCVVILMWRWWRRVCGSCLVVSRRWYVSRGGDGMGCGGGSGGGGGGVVLVRRWW